LPDLVSEGGIRGTAGHTVPRIAFIKAHSATPHHPHSHGKGIAPGRMESLPSLSIDKPVDISKRELHNGTGATMQVGKHTKPGAFSLTSIRVRSDEVQQLSEYSMPILAELARMPGFISNTALFANNCGYTITAWEDAESASKMLRAGAHRKAIKVFFGSEFAEGGMTSVWIPHHLNALWVRCTACGRMSDYDQDEGKCQCGQLLPLLPYW